MTNQLTLRQRKVLTSLRGAISSETAEQVVGADYQTAITLARHGVLNLRLSSETGEELFWKTQLREAMTGATVPAGFVIILNKGIREPGGKMVNFFLARTKSYDLTQKTFRLMLAAWTKELGLFPRDLSTGLPMERIPYDDPRFSNSDHIVLE